MCRHPGGHWLVVAVWFAGSVVSASDAPTNTPPGNAVRLDAARAAELAITLQGSVGGIGAELRQTNGLILVTKVLAGTPAERAGLAVGSEIVAINGISTKGMALDDAVKLVRGMIGTPVSLDIRGPSGPPTHLEIVREKVSIGKPVATMCHESVGMIRLSTFNAETVAEVRQALQQLQAKGARALVLDLRDCGGGDIRVKQEVVSLFLAEGTPLWLIENKQTGERKLVKSSAAGAFVSLPLAVLVNKRTAGELPAAAIGRNKRGVLIGQKTSGSSIVKKMEKNKDGSSSIVETDILLTSTGEPISGAGVLPDIPLPDAATEEQFIDKALEQLGKVLP